MLDRAALQALQAVLTTGSFEAAAAQLHITQSAVSQRIRGLEERVGTGLVNRTRPATPSDAGAKVLAHAEAVGMLEQSLARDLGGLVQMDATQLRIAVTADSLATFVLPALARVHGVLFDLVIDDQDHSAELLRRGEVSGVITATARPMPGCDAIPIRPLRYLAFASPPFIAQYFSDGLTTEALAKAPAITFNHKDRLQRDWARAVCGTRVTPPTHFIGSSQDITSAARAGLGWAVNPEELVAPHLTDGSLVELAPEHRFETPLFWQVPRQMKDALAPVTQALRAAG